MKNKNSETRAICGVDIRDIGAIKAVKSPYINEVAVLADGDFRDLRIQSANESGFVIPEDSIAKGISVSSTLNTLVDNPTKPAKGIEPSNQRMTNPDSLQAAGVFILSQCNECAEVNEWEGNEDNIATLIFDHTSSLDHYSRNQMTDPQVSRARACQNQARLILATGRVGVADPRALTFLWPAQFDLRLSFAYVYSIPHNKNNVSRLCEKGNELVANCNQLKTMAVVRKFRTTAVEVKECSTKCFAYFPMVLYHGLYKPQLFSRTGPAARVSCGVWYSTQETDAEPVVYSHGINSTRVPSPLVVSGTGKMGGKNNQHKPLRYFEAACAVHSALP